MAEVQEPTISGEELVVSAAPTAVAIAKCMTHEELGAFSEFLGLLKHNIDIIRVRRFLQRVEQEKRERKPPTS